LPSGGEGKEKNLYQRGEDVPERKEIHMLVGGSIKREKKKNQQKTKIGNFPVERRNCGELNCCAIPTGAKEVRGGDHHEQAPLTENTDSKGKPSVLPGEAHSKKEHWERGTEPRTKRNIC